MTEIDEAKFLLTHTKCIKYYDNGNIQSTHYMFDNLIDGEEKIWREDGKLLIQSNWVKGKKEGKFEQWHANGMLSEICYFKNNKKNGESKKWYYNGLLKKHTLYRHGEVLETYK